MIFYIILEFICFILIALTKFLFKTRWMLNILTMSPIILTIIYNSFFKKEFQKEKNILYLAILFAGLGDLCFVYFENIYGIYFFFLIQLCLLYYLNKSNLKIAHISILALMVFVLCFTFKKFYLLVIGILYIFIFLFNLINLKKQSQFNSYLNVLLFSFVLLSLCDINVFLIYVINYFHKFLYLENIFFVFEWGTYILFQIFITFYLRRIFNKSMN